MTAPANAVVKSLTDRRLDVDAPAVHHLLYLCQGHHLGWFAEPLFAEPILATDRGPHVEFDPGEDIRLPNRELNTIGYVLSRYGNLLVRDLATLIRAQSPYQLAEAGRQPGQTAHISVDVLRQHFAAANAVERAETGISEEAVAQLVAGARERLNDPLSVDTPQVRERMRARFADHAR